MKILIATDIHGSAYYARKVTEKFKQVKADLMVLLGDVYNHGPRNNLPRDYDPLVVAECFNAVCGKTVAVQGNCDSEVDQDISAFPFVRNHLIVLENRRLYFTHGHIFNQKNPPETAARGDVIFYGHFHVNEISAADGMTFVGVGSASLPKDGRNSYCIYNDGVITLYDLDDNVIETCALS